MSFMRCGDTSRGEDDYDDDDFSWDSGNEVFLVSTSVVVLILIVITVVHFRKSQCGRIWL
jgi:hypothetical protein